MKSVLYLVRKNPSISSNETVDMMLVSGVFEQPCSVIFIDDGVHQLFGDSNIVRIKDTSRALSALPTYGIDQIYVDKKSLLDRALETRTSRIPFEVVEEAKVTYLLSQHDIVITD